MKKVIVIASAVIAILCSLRLIIRNFGLLIDEIWPYVTSPIDISFIIYIIVSIILLSVILISVLVIFNIKHPKSLRILLVIISILIVILVMTAFGVVLFAFITGDNKIFQSIITYLGLVAIFITLLTYIRRALNSAREQK